MVNVCPPTVIVPDRAAPVFAATLKPIVALPLPDAGPVSEIQFAPDDAVHAQAPLVVSAKLPVPPAAAIDWLDGLMA